MKTLTVEELQNMCLYQTPIYVIEVTPQLATEWLKGFVNNRKFDKNRVSRYKNEMINGDWHLSGDLLKLDEAGRWLDGEHRLRAVISAKKPVKMGVFVVKDKDASLQFDTGKNRTAVDVLRMKGIEYASIMAPLITELFNFVNSNRIGEKTTSVNSYVANVYLTHHMYKEFATIDPNLSLYVDIYGKKDQLMIISKSLMAAIHYVLSTSGSDIVDEFMLLLKQGIPQGINILNKNQIEMTLRCREIIRNLQERHKNDKNKYQRPTPYIITNFIFKTWNYVVRNKYSKTTVIRPEEEYNEPLYIDINKILFYSYYKEKYFQNK